MKNRRREGILEIMPGGFGLLRDVKRNFAPRDDDPYLDHELIEKYHLREGLKITGELGLKRRRSGRPILQRILLCNDVSPEEYMQVPDIKSLVSIDPEEQLHITTSPKDITGRLIDTLTPIGKGQRGMIVSPPKAGKTTLLKTIARAVRQNHPEVTVFILLVDERPEEVTDFQRNLEGVQVFHSSADQDVESHIRISELTMNMAIRRVEFGEDMMVLIDSLTRMGRAFNKDVESNGKTMSGGLGANALEIPRRFFGAARNVEHGGSLTVLASILIHTGSRMDKVIYNEFKGTGNLDLVLSRECADQRMFPAININESGTRKEHKILSEEALDESYRLRRRIADLKPDSALQHVLRYFSQDQ
ncbi:MAG TPA: transcription termination factor Rho [Caldithrix sp.]|nr:transcription termination factor Rho [Caldithrix sp.]